MEAEPNGAADTAPTCADRSGPRSRDGGQERSKMRLDADGSHPRPASAMGNAEGLVQIEMAHVGAVIARPRQADLRVEIGAIQINLPTEAMHESQMVRISGSNTPCVEGYVIISTARRSACFSALTRKSSTSTFPWASQFTTTTRMPAI